MSPAFFSRRPGLEPGSPNPRSRRSTWWLQGVALVALLGLAGCSSKDDDRPPILDRGKGADLPPPDERLPEHINALARARGHREGRDLRAAVLMENLLGGVRVQVALVDDQYRRDPAAPRGDQEPIRHQKVRARRGRRDDDHDRIDVRDRRAMERVFARQHGLQPAVLAARARLEFDAIPHHRRNARPADLRLRAQFMRISVRVERVVEPADAPGHDSAQKTIPSLSLKHHLCLGHQHAVQILAQRMQPLLGAR